MADEQEVPRPVHIRESGLLWLINKSLFHARGYALTYDDDTKEFGLLGNGQEAWHYTTTEENKEHGIDEDAMLAKINELLP